MDLIFITEYPALHFSQQLQFNKALINLKSNLLKQERNGRRSLDSRVSPPAHPAA
jgi:hypothetical protein